MPKQRFTSLDVRATVTDLQSLIGFRISNVYDINAKTYLLKLAKTDCPKVLLLIEAGVRLHTTAFARDKGQIPSGFSLKLRKHVRSKRVERIEQLGRDRLVVITCGSGAAVHHLVIELYDRGNVVLTDAEHTVLTLLRNSKHDADARVTVGDTYTFAPRLEAAPLSAEAIAAAMGEAGGGTTAKQVMNRLVPLGKEAVEHALCRCGLAGSVRMETRPWEQEGVLERVAAAINEALGLFARAAERATGGIVVLKEEATAGAAAGAGAPNATSGATPPSYDEFSPFELECHRGKRLERFETFSGAADAFFSSLEAQRAEAGVAAQHSSAWGKVEKIRAMQEERVSALVAKEAEGVRQAELVEAHAEQIDALLALLRNGVDSGMHWDELRQLVEDAAKGGDELAAMVERLELLERRVVVLLTDVDDDDGEEALTRPAVSVSLDLRLSALANARALHSERKAAAAKTAKTLSAAKAAVKAAEKKAERKVASISLKSTIRAVRAPLWFEKFDWFVTSENLLVLLARDAYQAELLIRRHLRSHDAYVHADVAGAPVAIVKQHRMCATTLPPVSLAQAGCAVLCRSAAWSSREITSAWWVGAHQVSKEGHGGVRLPKGIFEVRGQKHFLPPTPLVMGLGMLFRLGNDSVARHANERRVRGVEEREDDEADGEADAAGGEAEGEEREEEDAAEEAEEEADEEDEDAGDSVLQMVPGGGFRVAMRNPRPRPSLESADEEAEGDSANAVHEPEVAAAAGGAQPDEEEEAGAEQESEVAGGAHASRARLSAKQRRLMKKGRLDEVPISLGGTGPEAAPEAAPEAPEAAAEDGSADGTDGGREQAAGEVDVNDPHAAEGAAPMKGKGGKAGATAAAAAPVSGRGKHGKLKKMRQKYEDQDDEERELCMQLLGSAGKSKRQLAAEAAAREREAKVAAAAAKAERVKVREARDAERLREKEKAWAAAAATREARREKKAGGGGAGGGEGDEAEEEDEGEEEEEAAEAFPELESLLALPSIAELGEARVATLSAQDVLSGVPGEEDELVYAVPVCAPYSTLSSYKYKVKLTPGAQKKGKAAKAAVGILTSTSAGRERELMASVADDETVRVMLGNVKLGVAGKALQRQKAELKKERKQLATQASKAKAKGDLA